MLRRTLLLFKIIMILSLVGCTTGQSTKKEFSAPPLDKVFSDSYDAVWKAIGLAMVKYQMKLSDYDSGVYETQPIRSDKSWVSPTESKAPSGGQRTTISIKVLRGKDAEGKPATKVTILKRSEIQRDFFSEYEKVGSDGLEEKSIMYRIDRELFIDKSLSKVKKN